MSHFQVTHRARQARRGCLSTKDGEVQTPAFMPVATLGAIKAGIEPRDLRALGADICLANTYHLSLRPGEEIVKKAGELPKFMGWGGPVLTDSGGFQVFSLAQIRGIDESGVTFKSHLDGRELRFTPERATQIQNDLGSSVAMCFDICTQMDAPREEIAEAVRLTTKWAEQCRKAHKNKAQLLFGIVQGGLNPELCEQSARELVEIGFDGYALGGLANGLPISEKTTQMTCGAIELRTPFLPEDKPRYLMGLGTPRDILEGIERGMDMFDCVLPARMARHGVLYTRTGEMKIKNEKYKEDFGQVEEGCDCPLCNPENGYSRAFVRHLFTVKEDLARRLCTLHNLRFYLRMMQEARAEIERGSFAEWKKDFLQKMSGK